MASKQKTAPHEKSPKPLKVGSRVRCTDDGVEGRITWANALSVKIRWDDGEQVTWRRDSLADRPLEVLDPVDKAEAQPADPVQTPAPLSAREQAAVEAPAAADTDPTTAQPTTPVQEPAPEAPAVEQAPETPAYEPSVAEPPPVDESAKMKKTRQQQESNPKEKKCSALDAAAQVLAQTGTPMNCQELIAAMAAQGLWSSPAGKTPSATLYSALLREAQTKGEQARFVKVDRGKFALRNHGALQ